MDNLTQGRRLTEAAQAFRLHYRKGCDCFLSNDCSGEEHEAAADLCALLEGP